MAAGSILIAMALQGIALENRIVRAAPAGEDAAGYAAIVNPGPEDRLVEIRCACAERVEIHRVTRSGESVSMEREPSLAVPGGGRVEIRPGSDLHLMLMALRAPLAEGASVPMILRFERAGAVTANFAAVGDSRAAWAAGAAPPLAAELGPLAFLVGSCWRATFPGTTHTDTHCYTAMLGGRYVRDLHVVEGAPTPYSGETIYRWDAAARRIRYDYYASDGGTSSGTAEPNAAGLDFPEETYVSGTGERMVLRNAWSRDGDSAFNGVSSMRHGAEWREMWRMRFTRVGPATPPR